MITKDQVSDLKSLILRKETCAVQLRDAQAAKADADNQLERFLFELQREPKKEVQ